MDSAGAAAVGVAPALEAAPRQRGWSPLQRVAFRLVFVYLVLFMIFAHPLGLILSLETRFGVAPRGAAVQRAIQGLWTPFGSWVGRHLHRVQTPQDSAEFDQILSMLIVSALAALIWSVLDRRPGRDVSLYRGLKVVVRYVLAFVLVLYGMDKVVPNAQFGFPSLQTLISPVGDLSVYPLFWATMGTSTMYAAFAGGMEIVAAGLLFFRRTALLGALLAASAMANVAMLNFGFDIPVKVFSVHLFLMSIFVMGGDLGRLANLLLLGRRSTPVSTGGPRRGGWFRVGRISLKAAFLIYVSVSAVKICLGIQHMRVDRSPLYGIYDVQEFSAKGKVRPPLTTDATRWKTIIFNSPAQIWIRQMDDSVQTFPMEYDPAKGALKISGNLLTCSRPDKEHLLIQGTYLSQPLIVKLTRVDESKFKLAKSRVPWILGRD